jgi:ATP-binding cassette subfamily B protein
MSKLLKYLKPFTWFIFGVILCLFAQAMSELSLPGFMSNIVDIGIAKGQMSVIYTEGIKMLLFVLLGVASAVAVSYLSAKTASGFSKSVRRKMFEKIVNFSNAEYDKFSTSSLITRTTNDIQQIEMLLTMLLRIVFYAPILGIGGVYRVIRTNASMGWIISVALAGIVVIIVVLFMIAVPKFQIVQKLVDKLNLTTREILNGIMVIRAFNTQKHEEERFDKVNTELTKVHLFINRIMAIMMPSMMFIMNGIIILIVWVGSHQINIGAMQVGSLMAFIQYSMQIIFSFLMISVIFIMVPRALVSAQRISEVLEIEPSIKDPEIPKTFKEDPKGYVEFKNVSFKYPDAEDYVLKNISFVACPGQTTAFIGSSGCGKSTLVNLIPRFYDVTEGEILIDGVNIKDIPRKALRDMIGYVPQRGILFSGTIESNLKYGDEDATEEDLEKAAEIAQAMEFIKEYQEGFLTPISQGGTNVSGGQRQRLSIARVLVKKPKIYIFDDSFSALDFKTDAALRKALKTVTRNSTVLIVAQRIGTVMDAEQIVVLDEGVIVGIGTHKELLKTCKVYQEIAFSQLSKEELE